LHQVKFTFSSEPLNVSQQFLEHKSSRRQLISAFCAGGNLEPVQMICELDWKECPRAIGNYIWREIVTDVLDCLGNDAWLVTVLRVLAGILICILLLRIRYLKSKRKNSICDKEILNKVGYKVEDLELKVNILTYKMQYGSWPLPHQIHKSNFRKNLRNLRLTLSNPNDRNDWIKHVLLSPRRNESYTKYNYPSEHLLTELFDAKKRTVYPYLRRDTLPLEHSSKSSKSSSDKSLKYDERLNSMFRKTIGRRQHKISKSENFEMQNRNAISVPFFSRRRNCRSTSRVCKDSMLLRGETVAVGCRKFARTMDDCKRYLKELHDSNKYLGLVCSSSETSDLTSVKNVCSDTQQDRSGEQKCSVNLIEKSKENEPGASEKEEYIEQSTYVKEIRSKQQSKENCLELSRKICPILKLINKHLLSSKTDITFCTEMFPPRSASNMLITPPCERKTLMKPSEETLYQVKKKLESLHNVLRTYETQNSEAAVMERQRESSNRINSICQNVVDTLVSVATDNTDNSNEKRKSRVSFDTAPINNSSEMQQTVYNSSEQYDGTGKSSEASIQDYFNMLSTRCLSNINDLRCSFPQSSENKVYSSNHQDLKAVNDNGIIYSSTITYDKVPERVYYTITSDLLDEKDINQESVTDNYILPDVYIESSRAKSFIAGQDIVPMETDEDVIIISPTSTRTEVSRDSEPDDKSTTLLLQEALQFRKALLTRVELEGICYPDDKSEGSHSESASEYGKCPYVKNNLQSKFLDIISEEQSISSSTEKTSRTYMFFNIKQDRQLAQTSTLSNTQQNDIKDQNVHKGYFDSKLNLGSTSEYFSFSNVIQEGNGIDGDQLSLSKHNCLQENDSTKVTSSNLRTKCLNHTVDKFDEKFTEMRLTNCLKNIDENMNERKICYNRADEREDVEKRFLRASNANMLIDYNAESVELFSQDLDEENQNAGANEISNFLDSKSPKQCTNVSYMKGTKNALLKEKLISSDDEKYHIEDNESLMRSPNLTLKRHPGTCSLIDQTLVATSIEKAAEMRAIIENADVMYDLSQSESKENSIETNLIEDSLTSSINHSNDSNIPEPPSVTVLINKSADEEEFNLNWSNVKQNFSYDFVNEKNTQTFATDTITLQEYGSIDTASYCRQETCNGNMILQEEYEMRDTHRDQDDKLKDGKNGSIIKNSFTDLRNGDPINEVTYKSYSNLISPHSSLYFTDEASSSTAKLNNVQSKNLENYLQSNLYGEKENEQPHCQVGGAKGAELLPTSIANEEKEVITTSIVNTQKSYAEVLNNEFDIEENLPDANKNSENRTDLSSKNYVENIDILLTDEAKETSRKEGDAINNKGLTPHANTNSNNLVLLKDIDTNDKTRFASLINKMQSFNVHHNAWSTPSRQLSPRDTKENTLKSSSQENYTPKSEKLKQNTKGLKSDSLNVIQANTGSISISSHGKIRDLSVEPRCNTERSIKLERKKSRSQVSFRTNESSKQVTSQSLEFPNNISDESAEAKLKLQGHVKPLLPTPKTSSKSCIPILKRRLEAARRSENEGRPKSPMRGPLTMTMFGRDNLSSESHSVMEESIRVEGNPESYAQCMEEINGCAKKAEDSQNHTEKYDSMKSSCIVQSLCKNTDSIVTPQEPMVIYVNIFTKYDRNSSKIVDPKKFLEHIQNRKLSVQKVIAENQASKRGDEGSTASMEKENSTMHKIVTIVSSVINGNELDEAKPTDISTAKAKSEMVIDTLSDDKLKHLCFFSVEQKEIDVTAKPSVIDTSTSISDLETITGTSTSVLNKFQICGTPKELNDDEYIALLEILHQEPNFVHLQELQNVCKELVSGHQKSK
ncbi:uncharacterized protein LOC143377913, partial [Andrena cerasifolii]|uniref:uncharacterized protein LOC143377913 n=1 Tax=Andrena cerasifolii TaxID=2819439 RepID=UPI00403817D9